MADLRQLPTVIRHAGPWPFLKKVWFEIGDDNLYTWAAALAYSWLFAIFPFFLVLLSLIPLLKPEWKLEAKNQIDNAVAQLPREAQVTVRQYVDPKLNHLLFEEQKGISAIWSVGLLVTIWAASGGMAMTMAAMDRAYDVPRARPIYKQRPLAIMLTLVVAAMILAVVILIPVGTVVTRYVTMHATQLLNETGITHPADATPTTASTEPGVTLNSPDQPHRFFLYILIWQVFRYGVAALLMFFVVALVYYFGPNVKQQFRLLSPGGIFTVGMWALLGATFRIYVDTFGKYGQMYGAVGGVIVLLFFFYLDALVLLIGAEINSEIDAAMRSLGHQPAKPPPPMETKDTRPAQESP